MGAHVHQLIRLLFAAVLCFVGIQSAGAAETRLETTAPRGFAELEAEREQVVDIYYENKLMGVQTVRISPGFVQILTVEELLALLPPLTDPELVAATLSEPLPKNSDRVCPRGLVSDNCGILTPESAAIIYLADRFRIDLFINPALLAAAPAAPLYLDEPGDGWSLVSANSFLVQDNGFSGSAHLNLRNQSVLSLGRGRVRATGNYSDFEGLDVEEAAVEYDTNRHRFKAGLFWAPGTSQIGRLQMLGVGFSSQLDTRLDRESLIGTPLVVYLRERGRVEIYLDERLLFAQTLSAGSHEIDTSSFPQGSYSLSVRISEGGRAPRAETRFYNKDRALPAVGEPSYYLTAGMARERFAVFGERADYEPLARGGIGFRLAPTWAIGADVEARSDRASAELTTSVVTAVVQGRAAIFADTTGSKAYSIGVGSSGLGLVNYNFDLRHVDPAETATDPFLGPLTGPGSYTQASGSASLLLGNLRLGALGIYRETTLGEDYSLGLSARWDLYRDARWAVALVGDATHSSSGDNAFVGISVNLLGGRANLTGSAGYGRRPTGSGRYQEGVEASLFANGTIGIGAETQLIGSAGIEREPGRTAYSAAAELRAPQFELIADALVTRTERGRADQYGIGGRTTVFASNSGIRLSGSAVSESSIVVRVLGARSDDRFEVLINGQPRGWITGANPGIYDVPTYRSYDVRLRPDGTSALSLDAASRTISLYPGNVARLDWQVSQRIIVFGQLVDSANVPLAYASITAGPEIAASDENGFFQIEAASNTALAIRAQDGQNFQAAIGDPGEQEFLELGTIVADPVP